MIDEETLRRALEIQEKDNGAKRLGDYLVEMGALRRQALDKVIRGQIERGAFELLSWEGGVCKFEPMGIAPSGEVEIDANDLHLQEGLMTEHVLIKGLTELDKARNSEAAEAAAAGVPETPRASANRSNPGREYLKSVIAGVRSPTLTAEAVLEIQDCALRTLGRGVIFVADHRSIRGVAAFGISLREDAREGWVRDLVLPAQQRSVFLPVVRRRRPYRGRLEVNPWNKYLVRQLGGPWPQEVALVPAVVRGHVVLICYGDNAPGADCVGPIGDLELVMSRVALAMERKLLGAEPAATGSRDAAG